MTKVVFSRPSIGEHSGLFNITDSEAHSLGMSNCVIVQTTPVPTSLTIAEANCFSFALKNELESMGLTVSSPQFAYSGESQVLIVGSCDRSIGLELGDEFLIEEKHVSAIQHFLSNKWKDWVVIVFGRNASARITIYFDVVRFERGIKISGLSEMIATAMKMEFNEREATIGLEARQDRFVRANFLGAINSRDTSVVSGVSDAPRFLFRFASTRWNDKAIIWYYHTFEDSMDVGFWDYEGSAYQQRYEVGKNGRLYDLLELGAAERRGYLIQAFVLAALVEETMSLAHRDGRKWVLTVPSEEFLQVP